jgi:hypothetical protein
VRGLNDGQATGNLAARRTENHEATRGLRPARSSSPWPLVRPVRRLHETVPVG